MTATPFQDRHATVATALAALGVTPPGLEDMTAADTAVQDRLQELDTALAAPSLDDLRRDARKWVRGDLKATTLASRITAPDPDNSPRLKAARQAAQAALVAEMDREDWSTTALVDGSRAVVQSELENMAYAATTALEDLPAPGREYLLTGQGGKHGDRAGDPALITMLVNAEWTPTPHIDAYRELAAAWSPITGMNRSQDTFLAWDNLFQTMARSRPVTRDGSRADARYIGKPWPEDQYHNTGGPLPSAIWMDYRGNVARAFGVGGQNIAGTVLAGEGKLEPLADPLGKDHAEYLRRFNVYESVRSWALMQDPDVADKVHRSLQSHNVPATLPRATKPLHRHAGYASPAEALAVYLADHGQRS
ncbi:hypothetical protein B841_02760 [Corynebacterium maris DSM 45190]|uniref:Uncharacterized protein n=1 Tax=Corynebacterium maris DSM 45190 TaxID=1224163 RepID=S5T0H5_9CORY|nr:hypothetical protein [Corynebacterium maris]AGS34035.1 hypothetical protein B841_02760 [Corynebacterium maris DSM 45190]